MRASNRMGSAVEITLLLGVGVAFVLVPMFAPLWLAPGQTWLSPVTLVVPESIVIACLSYYVGRFHGTDLAQFLMVFVIVPPLLLAMWLAKVWIPHGIYEPAIIWVDVSVAFAVAAVIGFRRGTARAHNRCTCGYLLRANTSGTCPECGNPVERVVP